MMREVITLEQNNLIYVAPEDIVSSGVSTTPIPVEDAISISTGTYKGRVKLFSTFNSKDRKTLYAKNSNKHKNI